MKKKCNFYVEVRKLKELESKTFQCECSRHKGRDIIVVVLDGTVRELQRGC